MTVGVELGAGGHRPEVGGPVHLRPRLHEEHAGRNTGEASTGQDTSMTI